MQPRLQPPTTFERADAARTHACVHAPCVHGGLRPRELTLVNAGTSLKGFLSTHCLLKPYLQRFSVKKRCVQMWTVRKCRRGRREVMSVVSATRALKLILRITRCQLVAPLGGATSLCCWLAAAAVAARSVWRDQWPSGLRCPDEERHLAEEKSKSNTWGRSSFAVDFKFTLISFEIGASQRE